MSSPVPFELACSPAASPMAWATPNYHPHLVSPPIRTTLTSTSSSISRVPSLSPVPTHYAFAPGSPAGSSSSASLAELDGGGSSPRASSSASASVSAALVSPTICPALLFSSQATAPLHSPSLFLPPNASAAGRISAHSPISRPGSRARTAQQEALDSAQLQLWMRLSTRGKDIDLLALGPKARKWTRKQERRAKKLIVGGDSWLDRLTVAERRSAPSQSYRLA